MAQVKLESNTREKSGKGVARKLRAAGRIPAVLYGPSIEPVGLDLHQKSLQEMISKHGLNPIINLSVGGETHLCMIKDIQRDVFQTKILHCDLRRIDMKEKIEINVPLHLDGEAAVRSSGAVVEHIVRHVHVKTTPAFIPDEFRVDISGLKVGKTITVKEIKMPEGVELLDDDSPIVHIFLPRGAAAAAAAEE